MNNFEEQEWVENTLTVTNPRDVAVITKIALNYTPFIWSNCAWAPGEAKTAITIDDVAVAPHVILINKQLPVSFYSFGKAFFSKEWFL